MLCNITDEQVVEAKKFESMSDVIADPYFIERVKAIVSSIQVARRLRQPAPVGYKYKRDWIDMLYAEGKFTPEFFLDHVEDVWYKRSLLTAVIREAVNNVGARALSETMVYYGKQQAKS